MKKNIMIGIIIVLIIVMATMFAMVTLAFNQIIPINRATPNNIDIFAGLSNSDTQNGITVSVESAHGGNDTVFIKLKIESEDIIFDDNFEYSFLTSINFRLNPVDSGKKLIDGGSSDREVDKELWTEHIRYLEIEMRVLYDAGVDFSLGDGQERVLTLEFFGYYDTTDYNSWHNLIEGQWQVKFSYYADDKDININFEPFMFYGKGLMGSDRLAEMTSIRLNKLGMVCHYTALEIQEAIEFTADVIMKDGTKITLIKKSSDCGINLKGRMIFRTLSTLELDEIAYIQFGDEMIAIK